jgi:hypothetical protein
VAFAPAKENSTKKQTCTRCQKPTTKLWLLKIRTLALQKGGALAVETATLRAGCVLLLWHEQARDNTWRRCARCGFVWVGEWAGGWAQCKSTKTFASGWLRSVRGEQKKLVKQRGEEQNLVRAKKRHTARKFLEMLPPPLPLPKKKRRRRLHPSR